MTENRMSLGFLSEAQLQDVMRREEVVRAPLTKRIAARLFADKFDRMLAVGVPAPAGSALAAHAARVTSFDERVGLARTLRSVLDASNRDAPMSSRIPLNAHNIAAARHRIEEIALRLHSPLPVSPRGMARLRLLLSDGTGPLYRYGHGDLEGRLGAALAAL